MADQIITVEELVVRMAEQLDIIGGRYGLLVADLIRSVPPSDLSTQVAKEAADVLEEAVKLVKGARDWLAKKQKTLPRKEVQ